MPGFLSGLQNALVVEAIAESTCRATSNITANTSGLMGFFMGQLMKLSKGKVEPKAATTALRNELEN